MPPPPQQQQQQQQQMQARAGLPAQVAHASVMNGGSAAAVPHPAGGIALTAEQSQVLCQQQQFAKENGLLWNNATQSYEVPARRPSQQQQQQRIQVPPKKKDSCVML